MPKKDFLTLLDYSKEEILELLDLSEKMKDWVKNNVQERPLQGKSMAMIFQKRSTRTRVSTETGIAFLGGHALFLGMSDIQLGANETLKDTALVLSRYNNILLARVYGHEDVEELARHATVPVINALSDKFHPLQILADLMTIRQHFGKLEGLKIAWVGDGNNVCHSLMIGATKVGINISVATPKGYEPAPDVVEEVKKIAESNGVVFELTNDPKVAVKDADIIVTDTWISMGHEAEKQKRLKDFEGYQVTTELGKLAKPHWKFMHCLPRKPQEVTDEVFYSERSIVFDEAENRMYTVMAVTLKLLGLA